MKRYYSIDAVKFIAVVAVVTIHCTAIIPRKGLDTFWNYGLYRPLLDFAVPFFFAASGFFLYSKREKDDYLWSYIVKSAKIYVSATMFYILFDASLLVTDRIFLGHPFKESIQKFINSWNYIRIFNGDIGQYHLWYMAALIGACVILWCLKHLRIAPPLMLLLSAWFYILNLTGIIKLDSYFVYGGISQALFYLTMGYFLATINFEKVKMPILGLVLSISLLYFMDCVGTNLTVIPLAIITFYLLVICVKNSNLGKGKLSKLGECTLSVYILHLFVRNIIIKVLVYSGNSDYYHSTLYYPIVILLSVGIPLLMAYTYRLIKDKRSSL